MRRYHGEVIYQGRSEEGVIEVVQDGHTRSLHFGDATRQSAMDLWHPIVLVLEYTRDMMAGLLFQPAPRDVLLVGLGGGSLAKFLLHHYEGCRIDAIEPREDVVRVACEHFLLPEDPRLSVHLCDAHTFLRNAPAALGYDLVLVDAYDPSGMVSCVGEPVFLSSVRERLTEGGVLVMNLSRPQRALYRETLRNLRRGFPRRVLRLPVMDKGNEVALACRHPHRLGSLKTLKGRASDLEARLGLDFPDMLRRLQRDNASLLDRLLRR